MNTKEIMERIAKNVDKNPISECPCGSRIVQSICHYPEGNSYKARVCSKCYDFLEEIHKYCLIHTWKRYINAIADDSSNKEHLLKFACDPESRIIMGTIGTGKTYLSFQLLKRIVQEKVEMDRMCLTGTSSEIYFPKIFVFYIPELIAEFKKAYRQENDIDYYAIKSNWYLFDGLGEERESDSDYFEQIITKVYNDNAKFIITTNLPSGKIVDRYGDRVASRLSETAKIVKLEGKDRRKQG